jgi:GNAT superfamily N-acetyltransferase
MTARHTPAASGADHVIVAAGESDTGVLSQVIADAFFPLAPCQWLVPDEAARRAILPPYFQMYVEHAMAGGLVATTPGRAGAALWIPIGTQPDFPAEGYSQWLAAITGRWLDRFTALDAEFDRHHPAGTAHQHLALLAVAPGRQGQGIGTALLNTHHAVLDRDVVPAYLEASDLRTRALYLRHGYTDHGKPIQLPGGPAMYPIWREPSPSTAPA